MSSWIVQAYLRGLSFSEFQRLSKFGRLRKIDKVKRYIARISRMRILSAEDVIAVAGYYCDRLYDFCGRTHLRRHLSGVSCVMGGLYIYHSDMIIPEGAVCCRLSDGKTLPEPKPYDYGDKSYIKLDFPYVDGYGKECNYGNVLSCEVNGYWYNTCKIGNLSDKKVYFREYPHTELKECELCGKRSTPKKIQYRDVYGWDRDRNNRGYTDNTGYAIDDNSKATLCMGCYNRVRPIYKAAQLAADQARLISKIKTETRKWQKSKNQATCERCFAAQ